MCCVHDAVKQIFTKTGTLWPRSSKFKNLERLLNCSDKITAKDQAKIACLFLRKLDSLCQRKTSIVFLHAKITTNTLARQPHALGIYVYDDENIERYCAFECNWRPVCENRVGFKFALKDWTTCFPSNVLWKPFTFSFFITSTGYSTYISPKQVVSILKKQYNNSENCFQHDRPFLPAWEIKYDCNLYYSPLKGTNEIC